MAYSTKNTSRRKTPEVKKSAPDLRSKANAAHPSWVDMIKECIIAHPEDSRQGVSRPMIKSFIRDKYNIQQTQTTNSQLARAITHGTKKGIFVLPKGPSGRIKLAPKPVKETSIERTPSQKPASATKANTAVTKKRVAPGGKPKQSKTAPKNAAAKKGGAKTISAKKAATVKTKVKAATKTRTSRSPAVTRS